MIAGIIVFSTGWEALALFHDTTVFIFKGVRWLYLCSLVGSLLYTVKTLNQLKVGQIAKAIWLCSAGLPLLLLVLTASYL